MLEQKVRPYKAVKLDFLAKEINISVYEIRQLLSELILKERIDGSMDQMTGILEMNDFKHMDQRYKAMENWANAVVNIHMNLTNS